LQYFAATEEAVSALNPAAVNVSIMLLLNYFN
jgi:hypothetical protein